MVMAAQNQILGAGSRTKALCGREEGPLEVMRAEGQEQDDRDRDADEIQQD
jgi:hypothetical protein